MKNLWIGVEGFLVKTLDSNSIRKSLANVRSKESDLNELETTEKEFFLMT